ncbi:hypothetical protein GDO81_025524 [Engystomops pustulosus]|uniref:Uncharacterized protein n=1 Tax=Engystomops pustulosus TaxID=76066 RepID=A0AAV6YLA6_ENGPU|nr:hypothetical protein GDO81_025524 [Engystomops pustulosus]
MKTSSYLHDFPPLWKDVTDYLLLHHKEMRGDVHGNLLYFHLLGNITKNSILEVSFIPVTSRSSDKSVNIMCINVLSNPKKALPLSLSGGFPWLQS